MDIKISPSVLASDLSLLAEECMRMDRAGAHMLHLDVMDGHFVPNITFGPPVIKALRKKTDIFFDTHLMISKPQDYLADFAEAGSDMITFHGESCCDIGETLARIKAYGKKSGLAIKPATDPSLVLPYIGQVDMVLVMTVEPGFGGQAFMPGMLQKVRLLRNEAKKRGISLDIQVDGGINAETAVQAVQAGANILVAGSYLFKQEDYDKAVSALYKLCISEAKGWSS